MSIIPSQNISLENVKKLISKHVRDVVSDQLVANPLLSVLVLTFNHRPYIQQCLESILAQDTSFNFEIIVADDCSTDGTTEIIQQMHARHPQKIRLVCSDKNLWMPEPGVYGVLPLSTILRARGKYLSIIEGDDYLTGSIKFQADVDFLELNSSYNLCFHNAIVKNESSKKEPNHLWIRREPNDRDFSFEELAYHFVPPTAGLILRNLGEQLLKQPWMIFSTLRLIGICLSTLGNGKARYFAEPMSVYRVTKSGVAASEMHPAKHLGELLAQFGMLYGALSGDFQFTKHTELMNGLKGNIERLVDSHRRHRLCADLTEISFNKLLAAIGIKLWNKIG